MVAPLIIRPATQHDALGIAAIYANSVSTGIATFDIQAPSVATTRDKIGKILQHGWPYLVAERDGAVIGYAYAAQYRDRPAYATTCENSIYVADEYQGQGVGKVLLSALIEASAASGFRQMLAVISEPSSVKFHQRFGFRQTGHMQSVGRKFGRWLDTYYMQRELGKGDSTPPDGE
jgi:L-amino acid N-acyltransferase YncA